MQRMVNLIPTYSEKYKKKRTTKQLAAGGEMTNNMFILSIHLTTLR